MDIRSRYLHSLRASVCHHSKTIKDEESIRRCIVEWIVFREYWDKDDSLEKISSRHGIPYDEAVCFLHERIGERFLSMRKELRLHDAQELIMERPDMSVYDIADIVGITDKSNFRREFAAMNGLNPNDWKEVQQKKTGRCFNHRKGTDKNHYL